MSVLFYKIRDLSLYYRHHYIPQYVLATKFKYQTVYVLSKLISFFFIVVLFFFSRKKYHSKIKLFKQQLIPEMILNDHSNKHLHCFVALSGGELTQIVPLLNKIIDLNKNQKIALLVGGETGLIERAREMCKTDIIVCPLPLDIGFSTNIFVKKNKPDLMIFVENVYSPILAKTAKKNHIKNILISGLTRRATRNHPIYKRAFGLSFQKYIDNFYLKSELDIDYLRGIGVEEKKIRVLGNLKYSNFEIKQKEINKFSFIRESITRNDSKIVVIGSASFEERHIIVDVIKEVQTNSLPISFILCPRYDYIVNIYERMLTGNGIATIRISDLDSEKSNLLNKVILVDTFGELNDIYNISDIAILGGSFAMRYNTGFSQNILEPIIKSVPVIFGEYTLQFDDIVHEINQFSSFSSCKDVSEIIQSLEKLNKDDKFFSDLVQQQLKTIKEQDNVFDRYLNLFIDE